MLEILIYVTKVSRYNGSKLISACFTIPTSDEEIMKTLGVNLEYEEYLITDYSAPFRINEYDTVEQLNKIYALYEEHSGNEVTKYLHWLIAEGWYSSIEEAFDHIGELQFVEHGQSTRMIGILHFLDSELAQQIPKSIFNAIYQYLDYNKIYDDMLGKCGNRIYFIGFGTGGSIMATRNVKLF